MLQGSIRAAVWCKSSSATHVIHWGIVRGSRMPGAWSSAVEAALRLRSSPEFAYTRHRASFLGSKGLASYCACAQNQNAARAGMCRAATVPPLRGCNGGAPAAVLSLQGGLRAKVTSAKGGGCHGGAHRALGRSEGCRREASDEVARQRSGSARAELEEETRWWISELLVPPG